ncbi:uncharacterized protein LOC129410851 [Boleophthalmus pectinirostris]|uniref:uncharacterized protein LOC129410851 n=1 Tax=Boleophthalmus pectinirostris TaxID=150288 RepID=UPI00242D9A40|nr:uncharacterized protein LOC129410851 [Boleophthalmus pectinirostris]
MRLPIFHYDIHIINQTESHKHSCSESVCQDKLPVHDSEKIYCLIMSGEMKKISVQATEKYCSKPLKAAGISALAYILPIVLVVVGGLLIVLMVFVKKTKSMPLLPSSLNISKSNGHRPEQKSHESEYSSAHLDPSSPTLLITPNQDTADYSSSGECTIRLRLGIKEEDNEIQLESEEAVMPLDTGYSDGKYLDEDEEAPIPYEPRNTAEANND